MQCEFVIVNNLQTNMSLDIVSYDTCTRVKSDASAYVITHCHDELITKLKTLSSEDNVHEFMHHTLISYCPTAQSTSCVLGCLTYWHPQSHIHTSYARTMQCGHILSWLGETKSCPHQHTHTTQHLHTLPVAMYWSVAETWWHMMHVIDPGRVI